MGVLIRIAFRNLLEHRSKTLIIGLIVAVGVMVMVLGYSFLDRAEAGVKKNFTENFTGDAYIYARSPAPVSILFGAIQTSSMGGSKTASLPDYPSLLEYVNSRPEVEAAAGQVSAMALFNLESTDEADEAGQSGDGPEAESAGQEAGSMGGAVIIGMEPGQYRKLFDNLVVTDGHYLAEGESGVMISQDLAKRIKRWGGKDLKAGDSIILQGISSGGFKMRKAVIAGLYEFKADSEANDFLAYADVDTARILAGLTLGGDEDVFVSERTRGLLEAESEDDIFGAEEVVEQSSSLNAVAKAAAEAASAPRPVTQADSGAWQFILVKLKNPLLTNMFVQSMNIHFIKEGIPAMAGDWKSAASPFSSSIDVIRIVLTIVMLILAVVAVFIIMNTLVVSVIERTGEIGTMRALGARKGFIWRLFLTETFMITGIFGTAGVILSALAALTVNAIGFKAGNAILRVLFGGPVLVLSPGGGTILATLLVVAFISVIAHIYPVVVALRVQPVRAMQSE